MQAEWQQEELIGGARDRQRKVIVDDLIEPVLNRETMGRGQIDTGGPLGRIS
jgi:hypothetical protein